jgi:hypothetical protein
MTRGRLFFETVKEHRGSYFVEYRPPIPSVRFATLQLVFLRHAKKELVAQSMESELDAWLARYPVPVMVSAFDDKGDLIHLSPVRECDHVIGTPSDSGTGPERFWQLVPDAQFPAQALDVEYLKSIYKDIPFRTGEQLRRASEKRARELRIGWSIVFIWLVVVPAAVAVLGWASPWIGALVVLYSLWRAVVKALKLTGRWKKSAKELQREEDERRMQHHHYHCERNPDGFRRLMMESLEREEREGIRSEADVLKRKGSRGGHDG